MADDAPDYRELMAQLEVAFASEQPRGLSRFEGPMTARPEVSGEQALVPRAWASEQAESRSGGVNVGMGPFSGGARITADETGKPVNVGLNAKAGPVDYQYGRAPARGAPGQHSFTLNLDPADVGARLQAILAQGPGGQRSYGVGIGGDDWNVQAMHDPQRRATQISGGMQRRFAEGGPVYDELGNIVIGDNTDYRDMPGYGAIEAASIGAGQMGQAVGEPIRQAAAGIGDVPSSIARYLAETSKKPDPSQRMAEDIRRVGGAFADQAMSSPTEFAKTVGGFIPGVGEAISAYDAKHLYGDLQKAEAEGDTGKANTLRQLYGLATAGAIPGIGMGARVAGKVAQGAERAAARELSSMGLYSHGAETAAGLQQAKGTPEQFAGMLQKYGVKPDEMYAAGFADEAATAAARLKIESEFAPKVAEAQRAMEGLEPGTPEFKAAERQFKNISSTMRSEMDRALVLGEDWAARPSVTRDEIAAHFKEKMPQIEETVLGGKNRDIAKAWETVDRHEEALADAGLTSAALQRGEFNPDLYPPEFRQMAREYADAKRYINEQSDAGRLAYNDANAPTKFGQYTLPGGENYREVLLKLKKEQQMDLPEIAKTNYETFERKGGDPAWEELPIRQQEQYIDWAKENLWAGKEPTRFQSSHWDDPNVLAHLRMADRTGPNGEKILHVEEIQSDWGQKGKKEGFKSPKGLDPDLDVWANSASKISPEEYDNLIDRLRKRYNVADANEENNIYANAIDQQTSGIPHGPYVTNTQAWTDLALKRALREAAEGGYDKLVWTPGAEQAKRYKLTNHINSIDYMREGDDAYRLGITNKHGEGIDLPKDTFTAKELEDYLGKEVAQKIVEDEGKAYRGRNHKTLEGLDLEVGGSGMKGYYDKIVPNQLSKLVKKLDPEAKIGRDKIVSSKGAPAEFGVYDRDGNFIRSFSSEQQASQYVADFGNGRGLAGAEIRQHPSMSDLGIEVPSLTITPKMREAILGGQTAFARGGSVQDSGATEAADLDTLFQKYADPGYAMGGSVSPRTMTNDNLVYNPDEIDAIAAQIRGVN